MILNYLQGFYDTTDLIIVAIVMIFALVFHNVVQTWVASRYGDASPRFSGFNSFDPQQHLEPFGVMLLFILGFGWPKAVPVNSRNFGGRGRKEAIVWYSGPAAYLLIALGSVIVAIIFAALSSPALARSFQLAAIVAIRHAVINLFPVFPLDGARAALAWGNMDVRRFIQQIASYGPIGFIVVFMVLSYTGVLRVLENFFFRIIITIISLIPGL